MRHSLRTLTPWRKGVISIRSVRVASRPTRGTRSRRSVTTTSRWHHVFFLATRGCSPQAISCFVLHRHGSHRHCANESCGGGSVTVQWENDLRHGLDMWQARWPGPSVGSRTPCTMAATSRQRRACALASESIGGCVVQGFVLIYVLV